MKNLFLFLSLLTGILTMQGQTYIYSFINGNAREDLNSGYNGTVTGATLTANRFGDANQAYQINGATDEISLGNLPGLDGASQLTVAGWFKKTEATAATLFWKGPAYDNQFAAVIAGTVLYGYNHNSSSNNYTVWNVGSPFLSIPTGDWYHFAYVFDGGMITIYVNGVLSGQKVGTITQLPTNTSALKLGNGGAGSQGAYLTALDDIYITTKAFSAAQIDSLKGVNVLAPPSTPQADIAYSFDQGDARNDLGTSYTGTVTGATLIADRAGRADKAFTFANEGDVISCGDISAMNGANQLSITGWFQKSNLSYGTFFMKGSGYDDQAGVVVYANALYAYNNKGGTAGYTSPGGPGHDAFDAMAVGTWFHLAYVFNNGDLSLYVNGQLAGTATTATSLTTTANAFKIGNGDSGSQGYYGAGIDDIYLTFRSLTVAQIDSIRNQTVGLNAERTPRTQLAPNPARDHVRVQTEAPMQEIRLLDLTGKTLLVSVDAELNVAELPAGLYLVQVRTAQGTAVQRLIKE